MDKHDKEFMLELVGKISKLIEEENLEKCSEFTSILDIYINKVINNEE